MLFAIQVLTTPTDHVDYLYTVNYLNYLRHYLEYQHCPEHQEDPEHLLITYIEYTMLFAIYR